VITGTAAGVPFVARPPDGGERPDALRRRGATVAWRTVPGMAHALAEEPSTSPASQTPHAAEVDGHAAAWFTAHLRPSAGDPTTAGRESAPA